MENETEQKEEAAKPALVPPPGVCLLSVTPNPVRPGEKLTISWSINSPTDPQDFIRVRHGGQIVHKWSNLAEFPERRLSLSLREDVPPGKYVFSYFSIEACGQIGECSIEVLAAAREVAVTTTPTAAEEVHLSEETRRHNLGAPKDDVLQELLADAAGTVGDQHQAVPAESGAEAEMHLDAGLKENEDLKEQLRQTREENRQAAERIRDLETENSELQAKLEVKEKRIARLDRENQIFFQQLEAERQSWQAERQGLLDQISQLQANPLATRKQTAPVETVPAEEKVSTGLVLVVVAIIVVMAVIATLWSILQ